ncbi:benzoylformate decarboxylase [Xylariaceae sp. FL0255]|nr:benzoylformate decarboxylase [Xylariaceae sp. FL0255]
MASHNQEYTVWHAFYDLLRRHGMTTIFGNPGSTEQPMLKNFPPDFSYIFGLQEASVVGMAGGYSGATRKPVLVSLHTSAGTGNAMGTIVTAFLTKVPLVIIAGQQTREMLLNEPMLANRDATKLPEPYIKWSYQPVRAIDVPGAVARGIAVATQAPMGPVYISVPLDDWDVPMGDTRLVIRTISTRFGPDPERLAEFAGRIRKSSRPALVLGAEVDKSLAWDAAISLAERLACPVFQAPLSERVTFPHTHDLFRGPLPAARGPIAKTLQEFDLVLVIGAEVFRYYPWIPGPVLPDGVDLLHITEDTNDAAKAVCGDSLLSDVRLALDALNASLSDFVLPTRAQAKVEGKETSSTVAEHETPTTGVMTAAQAFQVVAKARPADAILVHETPSNTADLMKAWHNDRPESCFTFGSGGLGWNTPAAVGVALAQQQGKTGRLTVLVVGDGSIQYSIQSIYTAVQLKLRLIYLVPDNSGYTVLKEFAVLENTPNVPWLDVPGLNVAATAASFGCLAYRANDEKELERMFRDALDIDGPVLIEFPIDRTPRSLLGSI